MSIEADIDAKVKAFAADVAEPVRRVAPQAAQATLAAPDQLRAPKPRREARAQKRRPATAQTGLHVPPRPLRSSSP